MTRENKLALVVGFALILVVGILISDHFSAARSQRSAELGQIVDPTGQDPYASTELVRYDGAAPGGTPRSQPDMLVQTDRFNAERQPVFDAVRTPPDQLHRMQQQHLQAQTGAPQRSTTPPMRIDDPLTDQQHTVAERSIRLDDQQTRNLPFLYHHVAPDETLTAICRKYYGDTSLIKELAEFNDISDPNRIPKGMRLRIPAAEHLIRGESPTSSELSAIERRLAAATAPRRDVQTYTVKKGDTLGEIAQKTLGSARKWRTLYAYNKDVIDDPDKVLAGTELRIPPP